MCERVTRLCLLGCTDEDLARMLEIEVSTLTLWKSKYPELMAAIREGREDADAHIAQAMYHRAKGYSHKAVKIFPPKGDRDEALKV